MRAVNRRSSDIRPRRAPSIVRIPLAAPNREEQLDRGNLDFARPPAGCFGKRPESRERRGRELRELAIGVRKSGKTADGPSQHLARPAAAQ